MCTCVEGGGGNVTAGVLPGDTGGMQLCMRVFVFVSVHIVHRLVQQFDSVVLGADISFTNQHISTPACFHNTCQLCCSGHAA